MDKEEKFIKNWKETRKRGRLRYAFVEGSIFGFLMIFIQIVLISVSKTADDYLNQNYVLAIIIIIAGGIVAYGFIFWPMNEYFYKKKITKKQERDY